MRRRLLIGGGGFAACVVWDEGRRGACAQRCFFLACLGRGRVAKLVAKHVCQNAPLIVRQGPPDKQATIGVAGTRGSGSESQGPGTGGGPAHQESPVLMPRPLCAPRGSHRLSNRFRVAPEIAFHRLRGGSITGRLHILIATNRRRT